MATDPLNNQFNGALMLQNLCVPGPESQYKVLVLQRIDTEVGESVKIRALLTSMDVPLTLCLLYIDVRKYWRKIYFQSLSYAY